MQVKNDDLTLSHSQALAVTREAMHIILTATPAVLADVAKVWH